MTKKHSQQNPQPNQWLFTCPLHLPTTAIVATLGMTHSGVTEVDACSWQGEWDMANAFVREYGYGEPVLSDLNDLQLFLHEYAGGEYQAGTLDQERLGIST